MYFVNFLIFLLYYGTYVYSILSKDALEIISEFIPIDDERSEVKKTLNSKCYSIYNQCLPYFYIIGAFKGGTTSLYTYLSKHPQVKIKLNGDTVEEQQGQYTLNLKEVSFYTRNLPKSISDVEDIYNNKIGDKNTLLTRYSINYKTYLYNFPKIKAYENLVTGEATPNYILSPISAINLNKYAYWGKYIISLREPIVRAYSRMSHYLQLSCIRDNKLGITFYDTLCINKDENLMILFDMIINNIYESTEYCMKHHWSKNIKEIELWPKYTLMNHYNELRLCLLRGIKKVSAKYYDLVNQAKALAIEKKEYEQYQKQQQQQKE